MSAVALTFMLDLAAAECDQPNDGPRLPMIIALEVSPVAMIRVCYAASAAGDVIHHRVGMQPWEYAC